MKVVVTGGSGFIGSYLVDGLLNRGHDVVVVDRRRPRSETPSWFQCDLASADCLDAFKETSRGADAIIHLAGLGLPGQPARSYFSNNVVAAALVLLGAHESGVERVILNSSAAVYGETPAFGAYEGDRLRPVNEYGLSKLTAELVAQERAKSSKLKLTTVRLFNVFGRGQHEQAVVPAFIREASADGELLVHGDGTQVRDFVHVTDVADAFARILEQDCVGVYNISAFPTEINRLATLVIETVGMGRVGYAQRPDGMIQRSIGVPEKLRLATGWSPKRSFESYIKEMCASS